MKKLLVISGPTATGKTDLALRLAKEFNGELISADSRQVYKGLDIGTGKLPSKVEDLKREKGKWIINDISVYMYDVVASKEQYTVANYVKESKKIIKTVSQKGKLPILVGGTGFYIKALIDGIPNLSIPTNKRLHKELSKLSLKDLQDRLQKLSLNRWEVMNNSDRQNPRRLVRAIELATSGENKGGNGGQGITKEFNILKIGLTASREVLYQRADERVISRVEQGMIAEAEKLNREGVSLKRMKQLGLEYGVLAEYLSGKITDKSEFIKILQGRIHNYIRRQLTWFKKEKNIFWFDIKNRDKIEKLVRKWYDSSRL